MSRSNYDKPFYVDVGTSLSAIRCASNHDVVCSLDHTRSEHSIKLIEEKCERMNREFELYAKSKLESTQPTCGWSVKDALNFANTLANHGWTWEANSEAASSCIYALCRMLKDCGNTEQMRKALERIVSLLNSLDEDCGVDPVEIRDIARDALAGEGGAE